VRISPNARRLALDNGATQFGTASSQTQGYTILNSTPGYGINPQLFTMCAWIHVTALGSQQVFFAIGSGSLGIAFWIDTAPNNFLLFTDSSANVDFGPTLAANKWYFVACVGNGSTLTGYVRQESLDFQTGTVVNTVGTGSGYTIFVGNSTALNAALFSGSMSDFQLYNYAKTQSELQLQSLQRQPVSMRGLVSYLPLRNLGQRLDLLTGQTWVKNGTSSLYRNARVSPPVPEVARSKNHLWFS
jgi:hypothetical protein